MLNWERTAGEGDKGGLPASFTCSFFTVLRGCWKTSLLVEREEGSKIGRKKVQRAGEVKEKGHQPQGQIRMRRGLQREDKGTHSSRALW